MHRYTVFCDKNFKKDLVPTLDFNLDHKILVMTLLVFTCMLQICC